ncbi:hypothetical protein [Nesterenkonia populi]|nr:hypothetical protein [Nesterenkonia populi]
MSAATIDQIDHEFEATYVRNAEGFAVESDGSEVFVFDPPGRPRLLPRRG